MLVLYLLNGDLCISQEQIYKQREQLALEKGFDIDMIYCSDNHEYVLEMYYEYQDKSFIYI